MVVLKKRTDMILPALICVMLVFGAPSASRGAQNPGAAKRQMRPGGPEVLDDGRVTFRLHAPEATEVMLNMQTDVGPSPAAKPVEMTKDAAGVWSATLGPLKPNFYGYGFIIDGASVPDPANRNIWSGTNSAWSSVFVPGPEADFMAEASVPHGCWATLRYISKVTGTHRQMQVYTPPGYGRSGQSYPVLYLSHGGGGNDTDWIACMRANPTINKETRLIWITCGGPEDVAYKNNLAMVEVFKKYQINHTFIQGTGGHVWDIWRKNLRDFTPLLFR